jgi:hypothetical protein
LTVNQNSARARAIEEVVGRRWQEAMIVGGKRDAHVAILSIALSSHLRSARFLMNHHGDISTPSAAMNGVRALRIGYIRVNIPKSAERLDRGRCKKLGGG